MLSSCHIESLPNFLPPEFAIMIIWNSLAVPCTHDFQNREVKCEAFSLNFYLEKSNLSLHNLF